MAKSHRAVSGILRSRARTMRFEPTDAERKLWRLLRSRQLAAWKFRRQEPLGPYILDFVCYAANLVIEVDGSQHGENASDAVRDAWLSSKGFSIARYWNNDVLQNPDGVALDILMRLECGLSSPLVGEDDSAEGRAR